MYNYSSGRIDMTQLVTETEGDQRGGKGLIRVAVAGATGFAGQELSAVWPAHDDWDLLERRAGLFCHGFRAMRR